MPLSRKAIEELKEIHKKHYGKDLSEDEAWEMGNRLLRVFDVLTRPLTADEIAQKNSNGFPFDDLGAHR